MAPSPSLPPTGLPQSLLREYEIDLPRGRKSLLKALVDLRAGAAGRVAALVVEDSVESSAPSALGMNSALDEAMVMMDPLPW